MKDPITPLTPQQAAKVDRNVDLENYPERLIEGFDQFDNCALGGSIDESMSARFARWCQSPNRVKRGVGRFMSTWLGWIQKDHGARAIEGDAERARTIEKLEENSGEIPHSEGAD